MEIMITLVFIFGIVLTNISYVICILQMVKMRKETPVYQQKDSFKEQAYVRKNVKHVDNQQTDFLKLRTLCPVPDKDVKALLQSQFIQNETEMDEKTIPENDIAQLGKTKNKHQILKKFLLWFFTLGAIQALIELLSIQLVQVVAICLMCSIIVSFVITIIRCIVWFGHKIQKKITVREQKLLFILSVFNITCFITLTHVYAIMGYFEYIS